MGYKHTYWIYRIIKWIAWLIFPKFRLSGTENLPDEPCVLFRISGPQNRNQFAGFISF